MLMRTVAGGTGLRVLATAEGDCFGLACLDELRREAGAFGRTVAKRRMLADTASAPSLGFVGLDVNRRRRFLVDDRCIRSVTLQGSHSRLAKIGPGKFELTPAGSGRRRCQTLQN